MRQMLVVVAMFVVLSGNGQDTLNPLKGDLRVHDPVMIKEGDMYYVFHTGAASS